MAATTVDELQEHLLYSKAWVLHPTSNGHRIDAMVSSTSTIVGGADAASTSGAASVAEMNFAALGGSGINLNAGGIGTMSTGANVTGDASATGVGSDTSSSGNLAALGLGGSTFTSASDGTVSATGFIDGGVSASSTDGASISSGVFDAIGVSGLQNMAVGGVLDLTGRAQASGDVSAESVDSTASATSGLSSIYGIKDAVLDGDSDGTILGTAFGDFSTTAESTDNDAVASGSQSLVGIQTMGVDLGGLVHHCYLSRQQLCRSKPVREMFPLRLLLMQSALTEVTSASQAMQLSPPVSASIRLPMPAPLVATAALPRFIDSD